MNFRHSVRPHRSGHDEHLLEVFSGTGRGWLRWLHISDDEAWVTSWTAMPQRQGLGSALMDVLTGQTHVEGIDLPGYRWFSAVPGRWAEPFRAWAAHRPDITHQPRVIDPETTTRRHAR